MKHEDAVLLLPEWEEGRVAKDVEETLRAHVASCAECRELAATYRVIKTSLHVESDLLVTYAIDPNTIEPVARARIATHVARCSACAEELRATSQAYRAETRFRPRAVHVLAALAASVIVVLGWSLSKRHDELSVMRARVAELERARETEAAANSGGPIALAMLDEDVARGDGQNIEVPAKERFLFLGVPLATIDASDHLFELSDASGVVWSVVISKSAIEERRADPGVLILMIPRDRARAGTFTLRALRDGRATFTSKIEVRVRN